MTNNEKRIITLLSQLGPLSKTQLYRKGHMGLATAVKMVDRLTEQNIVHPVGRPVQDTRGRGKPACLYDLNATQPLALGVDMEYHVTTISLINLKGEDLGCLQFPSPRNPDLNELNGFLLRGIGAFMSRYVPDRKKIAGLGIGIPGMDVPTRLMHLSVYDNTAIREFLEAHLGMRVSIDVNTRVYTLYKKWMGQSLSSEDFMLVSVRSGLGLGVILKGELFVTRQGFASGIGHYKVLGNGGDRCRCGDRGCLETVMNEYYFHRAFQERILGRPVPSDEDPNREQVLDSVAKLFTEASRGHPEALGILTDSAKYLSYALGPTIMVLNVPYVVVSGHFGPDGNVFTRLLSGEVRKRILSYIDFDLQYDRLDDGGFTRGAALLVLSDYYTNLPQFPR